MGLATTPTSYKLSADVLFARLEAGVYGPLRKLFNITALDTQPQSETDSISGTERRNYGQTLDTVIEAGDFNFNMTANRFNGHGIALAHMGDESEITAGNDTVTDELVSITDSEINLGRENVSAIAFRGLRLTVADETGFAAGQVASIDGGAEIGVVAATAAGQIDLFLTGSIPTAAVDSITNGAQTTTISVVADKDDLAAVTTDYVITDASLGLLTIVAAGALDVAALIDQPTRGVYVNYTSARTPGSEIALAANVQIRGRIVVKGTNTLTGKKVYARLDEVTMAPNAAIPLISDERMTVTWQGTINTPAGASVPGVLRLGE